VEYGRVASVPIAEDVLNSPETVEDGAVPVREIKLELFVYGADAVEGDERFVLAEVLEDENPPDTIELLGAVPVAPAKEVVLDVGYGTEFDGTVACEDTPELNERLPVA
jgi:hypothetical protein